jgi:serine/threonine protein kinase
MEYCNGGDLSGCLKKYKAAYKRPFSEEIVQYIMRQVVNGINFLHSNKIIHRDLKLDNILVTFPSENDKKSLNMMKAIVKIIDFGFATKLQAAKSNLTYTILGTPANMAPQILEQMEQRTPNRQGYDEKVDIWSLGTLCYEMLVGHMAFCASSMQELSKKVKQGSYSLPTNLSKEVVSFIDSMLKADPNKRLSARDLLKHDFLVKNVKQFQPIDVRKIPGMVSGDIININSNSGTKGNLKQTVWDIFNAPGIITQQPVIPVQQRGIPIQQPMPQMQLGYMVPSGIPQQQQFISPGYMPQMKMGYY